MHACMCACAWQSDLYWLLLLLTVHARMFVCICAMAFSAAVGSLAPDMLRYPDILLADWFQGTGYIVGRLVSALNTLPTGSQSLP